jgi:hypothetical protein
MINSKPEGSFREQTSRCGPVMKASVGDRILILAATLGKPVRDGEILEVRGTDGTPPYLVQWSDDGHQTLFFPGPDAQLEHFAHGLEAGSPADHAEPTTAPTKSATASDTRRHVQHWQVDINLYEDGDTTTADAVLHTPAPRALKSRGKAHRRPDDPDVPEIGDEIAAAHALRRLASHLLEVAESDLQGVHSTNPDVP